MDLRTLGRRRRRHGSASTKMALLYCLIICLLIYISALFTSSAHSDVGSLTSVSHSQEEEEEPLAGGGRRGLSGSGPGSYPPLCTAKCGDCTPCNPVHVAVPPGRPVIAEYYPEAWRCKCGNKLYMP